MNTVINFYNVIVCDREIMNTIKCRQCGDEKDKSLFYDKFSICKICTNIYRKKRKNETIRGFLGNLLGTASASARKRREQNREKAGEFSITIDTLLRKYEMQDGKCYYSGVTLFLKQFSDWQCSLERLDSSIGYTEENIALIACEFQGYSQWSVSKYKEFSRLIFIKHPKQEIDFYKRKWSKATREFTKYARDNIEYCICHYCNIEKTIDQFYKILSGGCKECRIILSKEKRATPMGHMTQILSTMKTRHKKMGHDDNNLLTKDDLINIFVSQNGLCYYSGITLQFGSHLDKWWKCSPERKDIKMGYVKENVCLICYEFNTADNTAKAVNANDVTGNSGWSVEKMNFIKDHIIKTEQDQIIMDMNNLYL